MSYLLDTSACVDYLRRPDSVVRRWLGSIDRKLVFLCPVIRAELLVGLRKNPSERQELAARKFFAQLGSLPFNNNVAEIYADIRATLERRGQIIGPYDLQIAAVAVTHGATLVTGNENEFQRVPGLKCFPLADLAAGKTPP